MRSTINHRNAHGKKDKKKCGLIYQMMEKYKEAFNCFNDIREYGLAIECLKQIKIILNYLDILYLIKMCLI